MTVGNMRRIAIIDHIEKRLYVEDITDKSLEMYDGDVDRYIQDYYDVRRYSWDYINDAEYIPAPPPYDYPIEIDFDELKEGVFQ